MATKPLVEPSSNRLAAYDWNAAGQDLNQRGYTLLRKLLPAGVCKALSATFDEDNLFRNHIVMHQHGYGQGEYRYFCYPLPELVADLRASLYQRLAPVANEWSTKLGVNSRYPANLDEFTALCHSNDQLRPTPLLLRYGPGDYNRLHQDLYGAICFPLQVAVLLDEPGVDFTGGELVLTEQKARMQARPQVVDLQQGDGIVFAVNERPAAGARGYHRVKMRHGVSELRSGSRHTLGIIFHDAS